MDVQKEISLRNAISYCIENNDVNTATNRIMEFIRDEKEAINYTRCCETLPIKEELHGVDLYIQINTNNSQNKNN
tara:strand:- start:54 stop:278 length:225 start_codon:yes stop_codon:yes gene_type:complete